MYSLFNELCSKSVAKLKSLLTTISWMSLFGYDCVKSILKLKWTESWLINASYKLAKIEIWSVIGQKEITVFWIIVLLFEICYSCQKSSMSKLFVGKYDFSSHKLIQFKDDEPLEFTRRNAQSSHLKIESRSMIKNRLCCKQQNYISSCVVNIPSSNIVNFSVILQFSESYLLSYWMSVLKFQSKPLFFCWIPNMFVMWLHKCARLFIIVGIYVLDFWKNKPNFMCSKVTLFITKKKNA